MVVGKKRAHERYVLGPQKKEGTYSRDDFISLVETIAERYRDEIFISYVYESDRLLRLKYDDVLLMIHETVDDLGHRGLIPGDRVAIVAPQSPFYVILIIALGYAGITAALIDDTLPTEEIERMIILSDPCALISTRKHFSEVRDTVTEGMILFVLGEDDRPLTHLSRSPESVVTHTTDPDEDVLIVIFSSGTTGQVKGACITYHSTICSVDLIGPCIGITRAPLGIDIFFVLPLNHIAGYVTALACYFWGATMDFMENISPLRYQEGFELFQPNIFLTVPAVLDVIERKVLEKVRKKGHLVYWTFRSAFRFSNFLRRTTGIKIGRLLFKPMYSKFFGENLRYMIVGASPCKDSTAKFIASMGLEWTNFYATTETNVPISAIGIMDRVKYGNIGLANRFEGINIRIADEDSEGIGEIQVKTNLIMKGYFRDPEATELAFDGEWFRTGDRGYIDNKNMLHIVGRIKESILLRSGKKVSAHDVDNHYSTCLNNKYTFACCGAPTDEGYEEIHLFVLDEGFTENGKNEIRKLVMDVSTGSPPMYQVSDVHFIRRIPKTSVGKVRRFVLRDSIIHNEDSVSTICPDEMSEDSLCAVIRKYKPDADIRGSTKLVADLGLDSIALFNIKCDLESRFNVDFGGSFGTAETVGDIWRIMCGERPDVRGPYSEIDVSKFPTPRDETTGRRLERWARLFSIPYKFEVSGQEHIPSDGSNYIVCANHESYLDPFWIIHASDGRIDSSRVSGLAAIDRLDDGLENKIFDVFGAIPVDRYGDTIPATQRAKECLLDERYIMFIFPEGRRSTDGSMLPFKSGAAEMSISTGKKILPVRIEGSFEIFPRHKKRPKTFRLGPRRKLKITFGEMMDPEGYNTPTEMTQDMKRIISKL